MINIAGIVLFILLSAILISQKAYVLFLVVALISSVVFFSRKNTEIKAIANKIF